MRLRNPAVTETGIKKFIRIYFQLAFDEKNNDFFFFFTILDSDDEEIFKKLDRS